MQLSSYFALFSFAQVLVPKVESSELFPAELLHAPRKLSTNSDKRLAGAGRHAYRELMPDSKR